MASYTIEDLEYVRRRGGISYEEAVALLDYHNGNVARALVDLERSGKIQPDAQQATRGQNGQPGQPGRRGKAESFLQRFLRTRVRVSREDKILCNLHILFVAAVAIFSPHLAVVSVILCLLLGCHIHVENDGREWNSKGLENAVRSAADNVRQSFQTFSQGAESPKEPVREQKSPVSEEPVMRPVQEPEEADTPTAFVKELERHAQAPDVPVLQIPVQVETSDGAVQVNQDDQGYGTATIE